LETHGFPTTEYGLPSSTGNSRFPTPSHGESPNDYICALARIRTWNNCFEGSHDIRFTTRARDWDNHTFHSLIYNE
jgi:hypothetical protein